MTRAEAYAGGFQAGRRWAEDDIRNQRYFEPGPATIWDGELGRAGIAGTRRGYRDTFARYEAGTLTRQMFEHAPRGGTPSPNAGLLSAQSGTWTE